MPNRYHALPGPKYAANCNTKFRNRPFYVRVAKAPSTICDTCPTKNSPVQTVSDTNNRKTQSGTHGFTEAKRALLTKVMVLLRPNAQRRLKVLNNNYLLRNNNIQKTTKTKTKKLKMA